MAADGWATGYAVLVAAGLACGVLFWLRQRRAAHALLDLELFSHKGFGGSVAVNMIATVGIIGNAILITAYLQSVLGFSPLVAALWSLAPAAAELPAGQGAALLQVGRASYVTGMHVADLVAAGLMVVGVIIALTRLPQRSAGVSNDGGRAAGSDAAADDELAEAPVVG